MNGSGAARAPPRRPVGDRQHRHPRVARGDPAPVARSRRSARLRPREGRRRRGNPVRRGAGRRTRDDGSRGDSRARCGLRALHAAGHRPRRRRRAARVGCEPRHDLRRVLRRRSPAGRRAACPGARRVRTRRRVGVRHREQPRVHHRRAPARAAVVAAPRRPRSRSTSSPTSRSATRRTCCSSRWDTASRSTRSTGAGRRRTSWARSVPRSACSRRPPDVRSTRGRARARSQRHGGRTRLAAGELAAGTIAAKRTTIVGQHDGADVVRFTPTWYCTTDIEPAWDLRPTGWRVRVHGDAPLDVGLTFPIPLERARGAHARLHGEPAGQRDPLRVRGAARDPVDCGPAADHAGGSETY